MMELTEPSAVHAAVASHSEFAESLGFSKAQTLPGLEDCRRSIAYSGRVLPEALAQLSDECIGALTPVVEVWPLDSSRLRLAVVGECPALFRLWQTPAKRA